MRKCYPAQKLVMFVIRMEFTRSCLHSFSLAIYLEQPKDTNYTRVVLMHCFSGNVNMYNRFENNLKFSSISQYA